MVEEGTLGLARSKESPGELYDSGQDLSKDELQRRMDGARESISQTVEEIKDTMVNQYEVVKDTVSKTLDWHEQVKKRPVAWSAGAVGAGFVVGYGVAAIIKGPAKIPVSHYQEPPVRRATVSAPAAYQSNAGAALPATAANEESRSGLIHRIQETPAYDRVKNEAGVIGNRFVDEVSKKAQEVILPAAVAWIGSWLEGLLPAKERNGRKINGSSTSPTN
jgi:hypothetical protein